MIIILRRVFIIQIYNYLIVNLNIFVPVFLNGLSGSFYYSPVFSGDFFEDFFQKKHHFCDDVIAHVMHLLNTYKDLQIRQKNDNIQIDQSVGRGLGHYIILLTSLGY